MSAAYETLLQKKEQMENELEKIERTIGDLELQYLQAEYSQAGTVLKGFEGFLSSKDALRKRQRNYKPEDRLFSLSSKTSPVARELDVQQNDAVELTPTGGFGRKGYAQNAYAQKGYAQKGKRPHS